MKVEYLIGKKNYEKQLEKDSFQYRQPISRNIHSLKFINLLQETADKKANSYKNNLISHIYIDKDNKHNKVFQLFFY